MIPEQKKLPLSVAWGVVIQGIRIRLGRSIVTILGVACGIAFLMSIFTGQVIKNGVAGEESLRTEARRLLSFLNAEVGSISGKSLGVIQLGALDGAERRLLELIAREEPSHISWARTKASNSIPVMSDLAIRLVDLDRVSENAEVVLIMGSGMLPQLQGSALGREEENPILSTTNLAESSRPPNWGNIVQLKRPLRDEEVKRIETERRKDRTKTIWILSISLLVTIICIANAMLMSVTERFQEIGTMKCLGATPGFIRSVFLLESSLMGLVGGVSGGIIGIAFAFIIYSLTYGLNLVFPSVLNISLLLMSVGSIVVGLLLSIIAAVYPATVASAMRPAVALRTNI